MARERTTDFEDFYERNEPDTLGELACLKRSVEDLSDEGFFRTEEVKNHGQVKYKVTAASDDVLLLTEKSRRAFLGFIYNKNPDPEMDIEEAADFDYAMNSPHT